MKNLVYSIGKKGKHGNYRNVYTIKEMHKMERVNVLLEDGEYPFYIKESSWYSVDELKPFSTGKITNIADTKYPEFTTQIINGVLKITNGKLDHKHLDKQIPKEYSNQNTHIFLEQFVMEEDNRIRIFLGS